MKILIVNKFLYPKGGAETYFLKLGEELVRLGHEVQYFGMEDEKRTVGNAIGAYTTNLDFHTGKLKKILYPFTILYSLEAKNKILQVLEDFQPDVVHINNFNFQLTPSILYGIRRYRSKSRRKVKIVYTAHDSQLVCPNHLMQNPISGTKCQKCLGQNTLSCIRNRCIHGSLVKSILASMEHEIYKILRTYRIFDTIVCPSYFLKGVLDTDKVLREKTIVMHNFVDAQILEKTEKQDYILFFGRFSKEKGIENLLKVCEQLPHIPFLFAGSGPLENKITSYSNVKNVGFLDGQRLYSTIAKARFTVFPSECYENCPFSVMESQICGTPVIGSNIGGIPELLEQDVTGLLFESGNIEELKIKIEELWDNTERQKLLVDSCNKVKFDDLKKYVEKIIKLYQD